MRTREFFVLATVNGFRTATIATALLAPAIAPGLAAAQSIPEWTAPFPPFRIARNLYYVGSKGLANYLITTPQGHILINSDLEANVPMIRASIETLGFKFSDVKILLISHAHWDHDAGSALIKQQTGARYMVMDADVPVVESGGKSDFPIRRHAGHALSGHQGRPRPPRWGRGEARRRGVGRPAHAGAHQGHHDLDDEGDGGRHGAGGGDRRQPECEPGIPAGGKRTFRVLNALPCDYFLGAHGSYFDMEAKYARLEKGDSAAFIDPEATESS